MLMNQLISSHFVKGLLKLNADFAIFLFPIVELSNKQFQLLLELGGLTLSGGSLDFCKLEIQDQISAKKGEKLSFCLIAHFNLS